MILISPFLSLEIATNVFFKSSMGSLHIGEERAISVLCFRGGLLPQAYWTNHLENDAISWGLTVELSVTRSVILTHWDPFG